MRRVHSFAPVMGQQPRVLILGSMPSEISLAERRYYANPRNAFWRMMARLIGFDPDLAYPKKLAALKKAHIALWDVLESCQRRGSLDSDIKHETPNDIDSLLAAHPISAIFFNGRKAQASFRRHIAAASCESIALYALPSTSPANARLSEQEKYLQWQRAWGRAWQEIEF